MKLQAIIIAVLLSLHLVACAPAQNASTVHDPFESVNRQIYAFNEVVDSAVLRPLALGYRSVTTKTVRTGVSNALYNLTEPVTMSASLLQGNFTNFATSFWRFMLNSTFGIVGLYDFAGEYGNLSRRSEDYGQTFAVWGAGPGPYLVLPILGPSNLRDTIGRVADVLADPLTWTPYDGVQIGIAATRGITTRERLSDTIDDIYETSLDPYATFRSGYHQRREAEIRN